MFAARYEKHGSASEVFILGDVETPHPGAGQVRVKIAFSGINPTDVKSRAGAVAAVINGFQMPHHDGAGVIDAVGDGVSPQRIGERVWVMLAAKGSRYGTAAEYCIVDSDFARPLPASVSFELGATLGVPAVTAAYCLFSDGPIEGHNILVTGGAGAVGRCAIELATWGGARVYTTVSSESKAEVARAAGADVVINYVTQNVAAELRDIDINRVIEVNLAANLDNDIAIAQPGMKIVSYAADGPDPVLPRRALMTAGVTIEFMLLYTVNPEKFAESVRLTEQALAAGALTAPPTRVLPLSEIAHAQDLVEGKSAERILLEI
ncbi:MAG: NADPH:quinone reductase [Candidatus Nanopelagicales bacterium]|nr:NADPH:quinone reductase [Candidatus Nanopelagicales bacterium]MCF8551790.1 NADPH:quinone reductase [Candidatus Nanopelagicales bacterium]